MLIDTIMETGYARVERRFRDPIRKKGLVSGDRAGFDAYCIGFLKWIQQKSGVTINTPEEITSTLATVFGIEMSLAATLQDAYFECGWDASCEPKYNKPLTNEELASFLLNYTIMERTRLSPPLAELAMGMLDVRTGNSFSHYDCGEGTFLAQAMDYQPEALYSGVAQDEQSAVLSRLRSIVAKSTLAGGSAISRPITVRKGSVFDDREEGWEYDRIYSSTISGRRLSELGDLSALVMQLKSGMSEYGCPYSIEWAANCALVSSLKPDGRAVVLMPRTTTSSNADEEVRRRFVENGWVEAVVALPTKVFSWIGIPLVLAVLNKSGAAEVLFADLSQKDRLEQEDAQSALSLMRRVPCDMVSAPPHARIAISQLLDKECVLDPVAHVNPDPAVENGRELGALCSFQRGMGIKGGTSAKARAVAETLAEEDTVDADLAPVRVVNIPDLEKGTIGGDLPVFAVPAAKVEKYALHQGDVLLSRIGIPAKAAVVTESADPGQPTLIASNNLYVLSVDRDKIDPWYLAAYLDSEQGQESLRRASTGTTVPILNLKELSKLSIPMVDIREQRRIGDAWHQRVDAMAELRKQLSEQEAHLHDGLWG